MTWADELFEKAKNKEKIIPKWCKTSNEIDSYIAGVDDGFKDFQDDLTLAVLEERNRIEEVVLKEPVCAKGSIRHHEYARSFKSLLEKCEELNNK